ncbi:MAG: PEP-CTERM sorting domain-containing protein [Candidatus Methylopumilus sp.]
MNTHLKSLALCTMLFSGITQAATTTFFNGSQSYSLDRSGQTFDTITSEGYLFTYTQDKLFTGGYGMTTPIGRSQYVTWPNGLHAQGLTIAPYGKAAVTIQRVDGNVFDITAFSAKVIGNTAPGGADFEVVAKLRGEDLYNDPVAFFASGYSGTTFNYSRSPNPGPLNPFGQTTLRLTGADSYTIGLYTDFALVGLTVVDASIAPQPSAVPEPSSYAFLLAGLGLIGALVRRKQANSWH